MPCKSWIGAEAQGKQAATGHKRLAAVRSIVGPSLCISLLQLGRIIVHHTSSIHASLILANTTKLTYSTKYVTG